MLYCSWDMVGDGCNCCFSFWTIFCPFTPLTAQKWKFQKNEKKNPGDVILHKCTKTHDHMFYCSWDMVCDRCSCFFFHFGWYFSLLPPNSPQNENFKKMKKILEISFYTSVPKIMIICYTVPEIWHVTHVIFIFHSGLFFTLFTPLRAHKIKISKKVKKGLEISSFYPFVPTIMIRWCTVPETCCMRDGWIDRRSDGQMDGKSDI